MDDKRIYFYDMYGKIDTIREEAYITWKERGEKRLKSIPKEDQQKTY